MGFKWLSFGDGFQTREPWPSRRFRQRAERHGRAITIVKQQEIGSDDYGDPLFSESTTTVNGFTTASGGEAQVQAGAVKLGRLRVLLPLKTPIGESGYELSLEGNRYRITSIAQGPVYMEVRAERRVQ